MIKIKSLKNSITQKNYYEINNSWVKLNYYTLMCKKVNYCNKEKIKENRKKIENFLKSKNF